MKKFLYFSFLYISLCAVLIVATTDSFAYSKDVIQQLGLKLKTIVIDAGHGGKDPGSIGNGIQEKNQTLLFAKALGKMFEQQGFTVYYTRTTDVFIPLEKRTEFANSKKADLFLSIHCNAHNNKQVSGFETYYLSTKGSDKRASFVASRENGVSEQKLNALQIILSDFTLNSKQAESKLIAEYIQKSVLKSLRSKSYAVKDKGVRSAPFFVLLGARMPSILIELGYVTNAQEAKHLTNTHYSQNLSLGIVQAIVEYHTSLQLKK